ncbi:hypothetical protein [Streptomyces sp. NPDC059009]|uniref:hypothetical protein n=1 Tax=Streptomyces sp. NPDC059009 TaxID=3346694 RepID=UPI00367CB82C
MRSRTRTRRGAAVTAAAVLLAGAGLGTWATDTWPFGAKDHYCWGAWEQDSGPDLLGEEGFEGEDGRSRTTEESAPTPKRPEGQCTLTLKSSRTAYDGGTSRQRNTVKVTYGTAPRDAAQRLEWLTDYLGDRAMPLPDGLPGAVDGTHGMLVLPKRCDSEDGRPTAVTLDTTNDSSDSYTGGSVHLGGADAAAELLVSVANKGMEQAGCAAGKPLRSPSALPSLAEDEEDFFSEGDAACRIKGMNLTGDFDKATSMRLEYQVGAVTRDVQSCSARIGRSVTRRLPEERIFDALMVRAPRLAALLDGTTGHKALARGWRGTGVSDYDYEIARAECAGRPTTFLLIGGGRDSTRYLAAFTNSVAQRLGCAPVAPEGADR